ncbi:glutathione-dependent formaldehyde-activating, GFA [Xylaria digitata]|nr:glutathione-dependent formaldehyde-activating, GFA [Xylaria digitata]
MPSDSSDSTKYHANCHCGQIKFSVVIQNLKASKVASCNCSICTKNRYLLVYPKCEDVVFLTGELQMASYRFGNANKAHKFCPARGTSILIDFSESDREIERQVTAVNIRTFVEIEELMKDLDMKHIDGKNKLGPPYSVDRS